MSDLATIFSKDPFKCSEQDIHDLVTALRARLASFKLDNTSGAGKMKAPSAKALELKKVISVGDIDL
jgi:hypothetical protein